LFYRRYIVWCLLRWPMERRGSPRFRISAIMRLPFVGHCVSVSGFCFAVPHTNGDEARWYKDRQTWETHDSHRYFFRFIHSSCSDRHRLSLLRTGIFRSVDAHMEHGNVFAASSTVFVFVAVPNRWAYSRSRSQTWVWGLHDQVPHGDDRWYHE